MSIASSLKKIGVSVYKGVNKAVSAVGNAVSGANNTANVLASVKSGVSPSITTGPNISYSPLPKTSKSVTSITPFGTLQTPQQAKTLNTVNSIVANPYGGSSPVQNYSPSTNYSSYTPPTTLSSGQRSSSLSGSPGQAGGGSVLSAFSRSGEASRTSAPSSFSSLSSNSLSSGSSSISLPSSPNYSNPGSINTAGLDIGLSDIYQKDPATGQYIKIPPAEKSPGQIADEAAQTQKSIQEMLGLNPIPEKGNYRNDPEYIAAQNLKNQRQQEVNDATSQLNQLISEQNQRLNNTRTTGANEGVTEGVFSQQEAAINRVYSSRALPLQAQIASAQGNLQLAQEYLDQVGSLVKEEMDNAYTYTMAKYNAIEKWLDKTEKAKSDKNKEAETRAYTTSNSNLDDKKALAIYASQNGRGDLILPIMNIDHTSPNFSNKYGEQLSKISNIDAEKKIADMNKPQTTGGVLSTLPASIQGKVISIAQKVGEGEIGKKYNATVDSINTVNGIDAKSKNPADHQAIVYAFAKALDPDSAVKEGEYDTIKKYAQSTISKYNKEITNAINGTGFLSEGAITNIKNTMNNIYSTRKPQFENLVKEQSRIITTLLVKVLHQK